MVLMTTTNSHILTNYRETLLRNTFQNQIRNLTGLVACKILSLGLWQRSNIFSHPGKWTNYLDDNNFELSVFRLMQSEGTSKISVSLGIWQGNGAARCSFVSNHKRCFHHNTTYFNDTSSLHIRIKRKYIEPCETSTSSFCVTWAIMCVMSFVTLILLRNSHIIWWNSRRWGMLLDAVIIFNGRPQELMQHLQRRTSWFSLLCLKVDERPWYLATYPVVVYSVLLA